MTKENFEKTIWRRLLKVIFVFVFIVGLVYISSNGLDMIPLGQTYYEVRCTNGKIIESDLKPTFKLASERVDHGNIRCSSTQLSVEQRKTNTTSGYVPIADRLNNTDISRILNEQDLAYTYSTEHKKATAKTWVQWLTTGIIAFVVWILFLWFIKRLFYYIAFGESIFKKPKKLFD